MRNNKGCKIVLALICALRKLTVMRLAAYLKERGLKQRAFAKRCETTDATVSRIVAGKQRPSLALAGRIERETEGLVTMQELLESTEPPPRPPVGGGDNADFSPEPCTGSPASSSDVVVG